MSLGLGFLFDWRWAGGVAGAGILWTIWRVIRAGRWVRSFGYAERDEDLLITHGLWFKRLTAIPYGRMLSVNVESGPLDRAGDWRASSWSPRARSPAGRSRASPKRTRRLCATA